MAKFRATAEFDRQEINRNERAELVNPGEVVVIDDAATQDRVIANGWVEPVDGSTPEGKPEPAAPPETPAEPTTEGDGQEATPEPQAVGGLTTKSFSGGDGDKDPVPA